MRSKVHGIIVTAALGLAAACSTATEVDQSQFVLAGPWAGDLVSLNPSFPGPFAELQIELLGTDDGPVEEYSGEGQFIQPNRVIRFRAVDAEFDTSSSHIDLTILDLTAIFGFVSGSFDGTSITLVDSVRCRCEAVLSRQ